VRDNKGFACHRHKAHVSFEWHHVWPTGYHGPNTQANKVKICPNAHSDIHHLMELLLARKPVNLKEYGPQIRRLAYRGVADVLHYAETWAAEIEAG
jgi:hypothetical protein